jgi:glutathione S-transferase
MLQTAQAPIGVVRAALAASPEVVLVASSSPMSNTRPRLVVLPLSPWSERVRWALDHHGIGYELWVHMPFIGERRLRRLVGAGASRATVPVLLLPGEVLRESWDIACYADRHGNATRLIPADRSDEVRHYNDLADRTMVSARALVTAALLRSPAALDETLPREVPRWLRRWFRPIARNGTRWFARKYTLTLGDEAAPRAALRAALITLRERLKESSPHLLGAFSYADIVMAGLLQAVAPVHDQYIRLGSATRAVWSQPALAEEFSDLIRWRDALYESHRRPGQERGAAARA